MTTIRDIRMNYPTALFDFFDEDGWQINRTPSLFEKVKRYEPIEYVMDEGTNDEYTVSHVFIYLAKMF